MLNTKKLLYILPDLAYIAELLPAKKEHAFSIQSFRQVNGEFIGENEFVPEHIVKLFSKIEKDDYFLILPDFLFTNTIINVEETSEAKIKEHLNQQLLPKLNITSETHEIETFALTEFKGTSKVQFSAIEKTVLGPIRAAAEESGVNIVGVSPLSWTMKSVISLEPSISILQIGDQLYSAEHYIGIDQTSNASVDNPESIAETVKTLKGAEPNIQTVYLLVNEVVEKSLADELSGTLPTQQLASFKEDDSKMPSYVRQIIETSMKTLSIEDYPVPRFLLGPASEEEKKLFIVEQVEELDPEDQAEDDSLVDSEAVVPEQEVGEETEAEVEEETEIDAAEESKEDSEADIAGAVLPAPSTLTSLPEPTTAELEDKGADKMQKTDETETKDIDSQEPETDAESLPLPGAVESVGSASAVEAVSEPAIDEPKPVEAKEKSSEKKAEPEVKREEPPSALKPESLAAPATSEQEKEIGTTDRNSDQETKKEEAEDSGEIDLTQFALGGDKATVDPVKEAPDKKQKQVIKNSSGIGNMLKMIFITLAVFAATVAIGIGVGLGLLSVANRNAAEPAPTPVATAEPAETPEETPEPVTEEDLALEDLSILVVNATTRAGYAGTIQRALSTAGFGTVNAGNASGEYDPGVYVLMEEENSELLRVLRQESGLDLVYLEDTDASEEDPRGTYDAVVVLAE